MIVKMILSVMMTKLAWIRGKNLVKCDVKKYAKDMIALFETLNVLVWTICLLVSVKMVSKEMALNLVYLKVLLKKQMVTFYLFPP